MLDAVKEAESFYSKTKQEAPLI